GLFQFSAAVINGKIYIIGGCDTLGGYSTIEPSSQEELSSVYEYDPVNENWRKKQSLPSAMARNCSVFDGNRIYTMGGMLAQDLSVEIIDTMYSYSPSDKDIIMLDMGSGLMEPKAGEKTLPLSISNVPSDGIYGVDVTIEYDPSTLSVTNITPGTVITDNSAFSYNIDSTLGQINICYNGTQQAIINNGVLANIEFDVLESVNTAKSSTLSFIKDDSKVYGESSCEYTGLELIDGAVDIFIYGDVDGNGICNSIDYGFMNQYLMGMIKNLPGTYAAISGDVDASGAINSIDFALFRAYMLRNITKFPAQTE
ncbi:MAG TPA: hypothetical protein DFI01_08770, partial [Bacteroidales bacterium]|nr:hypothetical protein [Bacteroidales bacterium]